MRSCLSTGLLRVGVDRYALWRLAAMLVSGLTVAVGRVPEACG